MTETYKLHYLLTIVFLCLMCIGAINLYSANANYIYTQLWHYGLAALVFFVCMFMVSLRALHSYAYILYGIMLLLQLSVLFFGYQAGGSQRWLEIASFRFQPSEFAKLALIIMVAHFFANNPRHDDYRLSDMWLLLLLTLAITLPIFYQPDLGTAGICLAIVGVQLFFVRISPRSIVTALVGCLLTVAAAWRFLLHDYQKLRVLNLFNPQRDPHGSGYNSLQSIISIGSGEFTGKGYLQGSQSQLHFLPAKHTDFVLSVFAEEHGFCGTVVIFAAFALLAYLGLQIAKDSKDQFASMLAIGLIAKIFIEFSINVAMILGIFPVVGTPLPFFSYGGSSLLANGIALGLLAAVARANLAARRWR